MRRRLDHDRIVRLTRVVGLLALLAVLVLMAVVLVTQGLARVSAWAGVVGAVVGLLGLMTSWWWPRSTVGQRPAGERVERAVEVLRERVLVQWRREAQARSLDDPAPMPVRWRLSDPDVMDHAGHIASGPLRFSGCGDQVEALADQFMHFRRRRLVITGGAGSGKTTLAVQLLLHLLKVWQPGQSVAVLLSLASWDPQAQPRVQDWVAAQLAETYPELRAFGTDTAQRLADQGRILPVLDGLDEIPTDRRRDVIKALNASLPRDMGVIVTSRPDEYRDTVHATRVLTAAAVIEPEPLTAREAAAYLSSWLPPWPGKAWQAVLTALRGETAGALPEVVASPLGLWLLRTVYIEADHDPRPLIDTDHYPDAAAIQHHLLDELIPAVIGSRPPLPGGQDPLRPTHHHDPNQLRQWLTMLATQLRDAGTRDWRWWQLGDTIPKWIGGAFVGITTTLLFGFAVVVEAFAVVGGVNLPNFTYRL